MVRTHRFYAKVSLLKHIIKHLNKMTAIKPTSIKRIELLYENGTKLVVAEQKTPIIGKLFFEAIGNKEIQWEIVEKNGWIKRLFHKITGFFSI